VNKMSTMQQSKSVVLETSVELSLSAILECWQVHPIFPTCSLMHAAIKLKTSPSDSWFQK